MMELVAKVEAKVKELQDLIASHTTTFNNITAQIEQLLSNKASVVAEVQKLQGAIQAFTEVNGAIKDATGITTTPVAESPTASTIVSDVEAAATIVSEIASM